MHPVFQCLALLIVGQIVAETDVDITIATADPQFTVRGLQDDDGSVNYFYGIPFSKPRIPPHRFELPEEYEHEKGETYYAQEQKQMCVQATGEGSEDCLYLDVYMPASAKADPKFVLFWIHGGSWMSGSKNIYSLKFWAKLKWVMGSDSAVGVTVNYRLNILGYPDLKGVPLNLAMYDNLAALTWVKKHIGNFGGDKDQVTIFGESAGSMQTWQLWATPAARDLFANAISQSPYIWSFETGQATPYKTREAKRATMSECMLRAMQSACASLEGDVNNPACTFQTPTTQELVDARCFGPWYGPVRDGGVTISDTFLKDVCNEDMGNGKPLLIGHNSLEINLWTLYGRQDVKKNQMLQWTTYLAPEANNTCFYDELGQKYEDSGLMADPFFNPMTDVISPNPPPNTPESARDLYATSGIFFNMVSINMMRFPNVYMFLFNESVANNPGGIVCSNPQGAHSCEMPFVLTELMYYDPNSTRGAVNVAGGKNIDLTVQANMRKVWGNFALNGRPGWGENELGVFQDGEIKIREAAFDPEINRMLTQLMCRPETIPEPCGTATTTTMMPCPTTSVNPPCPTTTVNPCDTTAKFMDKYGSKTANGVEKAADVGPPQLGGGQRVLALSASIFCLAVLVAFVFRGVWLRAGRSTESFRQIDQDVLMEEVE